MNSEKEILTVISYYDIKLHELVQAKNIDIKIFKPKIIEVRKESIIFGMFKHYGRLSISLHKFFNYN
jgi:hypothetical protein